MADKPIVVCYGGGVNSVAMTLLLIEQGRIPSMLMFADTGRECKQADYSDTDGEKPETYLYRDRFFADMKAKHGIECVTVRAVNRSLTKYQYKSLYDNCIYQNALPSIAYGYKSCSEKWKIRPQEKFLKIRFGGVDRVIRAIGYDAGEPQRVENAKTKHQRNEKIYPLFDANLDRSGCVELIKRHGYEVPPKSSCFFCPSSRKKEIQELKRDHPDLYQKALTMEAGAELTTVKGLGRKFAWRDIDSAPDISPDKPCGCYDGGDDE